MEKLNNSPRGGTSGQSLIELLVALGLSVVVMMMALGIMRFLIHLGASDPVAQAGALVARQAADAVSQTAAGSWNTVAGAQVGTQYHIATSTNGFTLALGAATSSVNGIIYTNYITVNSVFRSATDTIAASGTDDPATKKITAVSSWMYGGAPRMETIESYVTGTQNESLIQTDWIGGPTCPTGSDPVIKAGVTATQFCLVTAGGLDYTSVPGSLRIQGH